VSDEMCPPLYPLHNLTILTYVAWVSY
jgi:hypothetical protein